MNSFLSQIAHDSLSLMTTNSDLRVESVVIGIRYTCVILSDGSCGVAYTLIDQLTEKLSHNKYLSEKFLYEKDLVHLINYCNSKYSIFRSVGVATLNALSQVYLPSLGRKPKNILALFQNDSTNIGMIGDIQPISRPLAQHGHHIKILDNFAPKIQNSQITAVEGISALKNSDHIIVSGSALVYETFDQVRDLLISIQGEKILLGPSAQLLPDVAFKHGFTFLGSSKIIDTESTMRVITEGGGYRAFKTFTKKYAFQRQ